MVMSVSSASSFAVYATRLAWNVAAPAGSAFDSAAAMLATMIFAFCG